MKITIQDGKGRPINPYTSATYIREEAIRFNKFREEHPPLIVLDQNGLEYKEPGEYEAEKVWQMKSKALGWIIMVSTGMGESFRKKYPKNTYRQVYRLTPTPTLEGKEEEKQKTPRQIYLEEQKEVYEKQKADKLKSMNSAKNIEELAEIMYPVKLSREQSRGYSGDAIYEYAAKLNREGFTAGCNYAIANSGLISKDSVISIFSDRLKALHDINNYDNNYAFAARIEDLTDLLNKIKAL